MIQGARALFYLLLACVLRRFAFVESQSNSSLVFRQTGLSQALALPTTATIAVSGDVVLTAGSWPASGVVIPAGRHVTVFGDYDMGRAAIDFGGISSAIKVQNGGWLEFDSITLTNPANPHWTSINDTYLVNIAFVAFGSIDTEPNATVVYNNVTAQYYSAYAGNSPQQFTRRVDYAIVNLFGDASQRLTEPSNTSITWTGTNYLPIAATANVTDGATTFNLTVINSTATCVNAQAATSSGHHFPWWAGLILGLGLAIILALSVCAGLYCFTRHKRRRKSAKAAQAQQQNGVHGLQGAINPLALGSPFNVVAANGGSGMHTQDDSAMIVPKFSSAPEEGLHKNTIALARAGTSSAPPDVYEANMKIGNSQPPNLSPSSASSGSNIGTFPSDYRRQSSGNERTSANSNASMRAGRTSAGAAAASVPELFRQRSHMPLDEVELGPLLGRGAYGRVFKGRWKGALVAVKVIDHRIKGNGNAVDIQRETILSTSVVHPNVVSTYKIVTVNASRQLSDPYASVPRQITSAGKRLTSHPEDSATVEQDMVDDELQNDPNAKDEMQTWMLLEYCDRGSMEKACEQNRFMNKLDGKPDMLNIYKSLQDIAAGMDYLHTVGVLHGDLKGANVLLKSTATDPRGFQCKLADFGLSRVLDLDMTHISTHTYGTISYMPPELLSQGKMTRAADVYSFGMLMWEMYTGSSLFKGLTVGQVFFMVVYEHHRPAVPEDCPQAFKTLMTSCWSADPAVRPTFQQIMKDLQALYQQCRKKPLQSAASAPAKVTPERGSSAAPPPADAPPLRLRPTTADANDLGLPRVGQSAFRSVTEPQQARSRSRQATVSEHSEQPGSPASEQGRARGRQATVSEQNEQPGSPHSGIGRSRSRQATVSEQSEQPSSAFAEPGHLRSRQATISEQNEQPSSPFSASRHAPQQGPPPPSTTAPQPLVRSPFDGSPDEDLANQQSVSTTSGASGQVPSLEEAQRRMAASVMARLPPESMMRANPRSSLGWRDPAQVLLQMSNMPQVAGDSTAGQKLQ